MAARIVQTARLMSEDEAEMHIGSREALVIELTSNLDSAVGPVTPLAFTEDSLKQLLLSIQEHADRYEPIREG